MQPMLNYQRRDRRNLDHLMAQGIWILSFQQSAAAAAAQGVIRMARLTAASAALVRAPFLRFECWAVTGGRLGGVARDAADPLPEAGQLCGQGGELGTKLLDLPLLNHDERVEFSHTLNHYYISQRLNLIKLTLVFLRSIIQVSFLQLNALANALIKHTV
jgi:hypothetical protein